MLALRCPHCRAVAPIPLSAREVLQCDSCGQASELPEAARLQLEAADQLLKRTDPARRKLSRAQADALLSAQTRREGLWVLNAAFILLALIWAIGNTVAMVDANSAWDERLIFMAMGFLPLLTVVAGAWFGARNLTARRRALAERCAASPPAVPGAPVRCRICAAPIQPRGTEKVAECGYCGADNLVSKEVLARAVHRHQKLAANLQQEVKSALLDVSAAAKSAYAGAIGFALGAPAVGFGVAFVLVIVLMGTQLEVDRSAQYAVVQEEGRQCIARIVAGKLELRRGDGALQVVHRILEDAVVLERADATRFVGRVLRDAEDKEGKQWKVKDVKRKLGGRNVPLFGEEDAPFSTELEAFCLAEAR